MTSINMLPTVRHDSGVATRLAVITSTRSLLLTALKHVPGVLSQDHISVSFTLAHYAAFLQSSLPQH